MLVAVQVDTTVSQCRIGRNKIGKFDDFNFQSLLGRFSGNGFNDLRMRADCRTDFKYAITAPDRRRLNR